MRLLEFDKRAVISPNGHIIDDDDLDIPNPDHGDIIRSEKGLFIKGDRSDVRRAAMQNGSVKVSMVRGQILFELITDEVTTESFQGILEFLEIHKEFDTIRIRDDETNEIKEFSREALMDMKFVSEFTSVMKSKEVVFESRIQVPILSNKIKEVREIIKEQLGKGWWITTDGEKLEVEGKKTHRDIVKNSPSKFGVRSEEGILSNKAIDNGAIRIRKRAIEFGDDVTRKAVNGLKDAVMKIRSDDFLIRNFDSKKDSTVSKVEIMSVDRPAGLKALVKDRVGIDVG